MDRRKFFRLLGAGGLFSLLKGRAQGAPWDERAFATLSALGAPPLGVRHPEPL